MNTQFKQQIQPQIQGIHPYVPGKPVSELQRELGLESVTKLASNENPLGASPLVLEALQREFADIGRYPDGGAYRLKSTLAEFVGLAASQVALGNGSNELLELVARVFAGPTDEIIYSQYAFAVYPISAQVVGAKGIEVAAVNWGHDLQAMLAAITPNTKVIYIANPNNPTGTGFSNTEWDDFISQVPKEVIVVLDEAYLEYADSLMPDEMKFNATDYLQKHSNLLISRTFSKAYGLASLRIGYMLGNAEIIGYINQVREPFNVNQFAQVAADSALIDQDFVAGSVKLNQLGMRQLIDAFNDLELDYIPSYGNFLCLELPGKALEVNQLLLQKGVIVRPLANYGMQNHLRVSIGTQIENDHFLDTLKTVLKEL